MERLGHWIVEALAAHQDAAALERIRREVEQLCSGFPVPGL